MNESLSNPQEPTKINLPSNLSRTTLETSGANVDIKVDPDAEAPRLEFHGGDVFTHDIDKKGSLLVTEIPSEVSTTISNGGATVVNRVSGDARVGLQGTVSGDLQIDMGGRGVAMQVNGNEVPAPSERRVTLVLPSRHERISHRVESRSGNITVEGVGHREDGATETLSARDLFLRTRMGRIATSFVEASGTIRAEGGLGKVDIDHATTKAKDFDLPIFGSH